MFIISSIVVVMSSSKDRWLIASDSLPDDGMSLISISDSKYSVVKDYVNLHEQDTFKLK